MCLAAIILLYMANISLVVNIVNFMTVTNAQNLIFVKKSMVISGRVRSGLHVYERKWR